MTAVIRPARVEDEECPYKVRRSYGLQRKRGGEQLGHVRVTATVRSSLHLVDDQLAARAGYVNRAELLTWWWDTYREGPGHEGAPEYPIDIPIWVLDIERDRNERPRMLARDSSHGYTSDTHLALPDEPEAVDKQTQEWLSRSGKERWADGVRERADERSKLPHAQRLAAAVEESKRRRIDLSPELRLVERALRTAERKLAAAA